MNIPTRDDLSRMLHSDSAGDEWAAESRAVIARDGIWPLIDQASDEIQDALEEMGEDELMTDGDELERLAYVSKRGAVKMLHAAFAAEQALAKLKGEP